MARVELIFDHDCPNVEAARAALREALAVEGSPAHWQEWLRGSPEAPGYAALYGSPTILVDGADVAPGDGQDAACCRLYVDGDGRLRGVPAVEAIAVALQQPGAAGPQVGPAKAGPRTWGRALAGLPGAAAAFIPAIGCPACWPALASVLGALGVPFLLESSSLAITTVALLAVALVAIGWRARRRRGYGPLALGAAAAGGMLLAKLAVPFEPAVWVSAALFIAAGVWNAWPRRAAGPSCPACVPARISDHQRAVAAWKGEQR